MARVQIAMLSLTLGLLGGSRGAFAQAQGPITPPSPRDVKRLPMESATEQPPIPMTELVHRIAQQEDDLVKARGGYTWRKSVRIQALGDDGQPTGEYRLATEPALAADGKRYEKIVEEPGSSIRGVPLDPEDLEILARIPAFLLTTEQLGKYDLSYGGKQQVDELNTLVLRVKPRQLERTRAYFEGVVWVEDHDFTIVKSYGRWVTETGAVSSPQFPFTLFETYRENLGGKIWFPSFVRSDDTLKTKSGPIRLRLTVRWSDYKPVGAAAEKPSSEK